MKLALNEMLSFSFKGRTARTPYWCGLGALALLSMIGVGLFSQLFLTAASDMLRQVIYVLAWAYFMMLTAWLVSLVVRRLHDISYSGAAALFLMIPGLQIIMLIVLGLWAGKKGLNRFGSDPLALMTLEDAAPVCRRAEVRSRPVRVVRETPPAEVLDPDPMPNETVGVAERLDVGAEDWIGAQVRETADKIKDLPPQAREVQKAVLRETLDKACREGRITSEALARWLPTIEAL